MNKTAASLLALCLCACGTGFENGSEITTLRVLGVRKDKPYPKPGESVTLNMLWYDGAFPDGSREIQRLFLPLPCVNPAGDYYYACFLQFAQQFAEAAKAMGGSAEQGGVPGAGGATGSTGSEFPLAPIAGLLGSVGDSWRFQVPADIVSSRPPPSGGQQPYGLVYAFFAICAGDIYAKVDQEQGFPIVCKDKSGKYLGADDFVAGYSSLYSYPAEAGITSQNPVIDGFEFNGVATEQGACVGTDCAMPGLHPTAEESALMPHVPACAQDGGSDCPEYAIQPLLNQAASAERDSLAQTDALWEQAWVRYYVERGGLKSPVRLVSDARSGWDNGYGTKFRAPATKGPVFIWAVAQDSRGGEQWVRQTVFID